MSNAALLGVAIIWGINVPVMKVALNDLHPFAFNALRLTLSCLILGLFERLEHARSPAPPPRVLWPRLVVVATMGSLLYQLLFITGVRHATAGNVGIIIASAPIWTAVLANLTGVERITKAAWMGLAVAFIGASLVTLNGGDLGFAGGTLIGNLLVLASAMVWAGFTVMNKNLVTKVSPTRLAFLSAAMTVPIHLLVGLPHLGVVARGGLNLVVWGYIVYSGLLSTGLAYVLWNYGIRHVGPSGTAIYTNLVPVITLVVSVWMLGEAITRWQVIGGALVLGGLVMLRHERL